MTADMLRPSAAAARFQVSESTLARWAARGLIGRSEVDGCVWYVAADITDVIAAGRTARTIVPLRAIPSAPPATEDEHWIWKGAAR